MVSEDHPEVSNSKVCAGELVVGVDTTEGSQAWLPGKSFLSTAEMWEVSSAIASDLLIMIQTSTGEADVNQDELIRQQQKDIDEEICRQIPLIGDKISLGSLLDEYEDDQVYRAKILVSPSLSCVMLLY